MGGLRDDGAAAERGRASRPDAASASAAVLDHIRQGIRSGRFVPGQRLREREIVEACAVGRSAVREALRTLAADGTLAAEHRRSAVVRQFTRDEVWHRHQVREAIEGLAASLAASRVGLLGQPSELIALERELTACAERGRPDLYADLNLALHALILRMSGNPVLEEHLGRAMTAQLRLQSARFVTVESMRRSHAEHLAVIDAVLSGNPPAAEAAMRTHIRGTRRTFLAMPDHLFAPG